ISGAIAHGSDDRTPGDAWPSSHGALERDWVRGSEATGSGHHWRSCLGHSVNIDRTASFISSIRGAKCSCKSNVRVRLGELREKSLRSQALDIQKPSSF